MGMYWVYHGVPGLKGALAWGGAFGPGPEKGAFVRKGVQSGLEVGHELVQFSPFGLILVHLV